MSLLHSLCCTRVPCWTRAKFLLVRLERESAKQTCCCHCINRSKSSDGGANHHQKFILLGFRAFFTQQERLILGLFCKNPILRFWRNKNTRTSWQGRYFIHPCMEKKPIQAMKNIFLGCVCFPESDFWEITFQTFLCLFVIRKVGQQKTLYS